MDLKNTKEKITVSFKDAPLIRALVGDFASAELRSMSAVIEHTVLDTLLPRDRTMRRIAETQLFSEDGNVGRALAAAFDDNSIPTGNWQAKHNNFLPLVQFARVQADTCEVRTENAGTVEWNFAVSQFELILIYLRDLAEQTDNEKKANYYEREVQLGEAVLKEMKDPVRSFTTQAVYDLLIRNWTDLSDLKITYRLLRNLVSLNIGWSAAPEDKVRLLQLMKNISAEWKGYNNE